MLQMELALVKSVMRGGVTGRSLRTFADILTGALWTAIPTPAQIHDENHLRSFLATMELQRKSPT